MIRYVCPVVCWLGMGVAIGAEPRLAYVKNAGGADQVHVATADGSDARPVTNFDHAGGRGGTISHLSWSADGKRLAFVHGSMMDKVLVVADVATGKTAVVVKPGFGKRLGAARWTPDGKQVSYLLGEMFKSDVYRVAPDGTGAKPLTQLNAPLLAFLAWAPNGQNLAVLIKTATSPQEGVTNYGPADLHLVDPATGQARVVAKSPGDDVSAAWAPDGRQLVVEHVPIEKQEGNLTLMAPPELRLISVADGKSLTLSPAKAYEQAPAWSPDGKLIAFTSVRGGGSRSIYVMAPDGQNAKPLTEGNWGKEDNSPAWAPDSQHLAFLRQKDGAAEPDLIVMDAAGQNQKVVAEAVTCFAWAPRP